MLRPRAVTVHRMIDTARRSEVNVTDVKRNRGALLAQRSLPRRRLARVGACGHEPNVAGTLRFLWKRKLAQRRPRDTDPASTRYPAGVPGRSKLGRSLSLSDGILNASTTCRDGSSNDRHGPSKRGQRDGRQAESRCAAGTAFTPASTSRSRLGKRPQSHVAGSPLPVGKEARATPTSRPRSKLAPGTLRGSRGAANLGRSVSLRRHPQCFDHVP